jgi:hypothetical protein
MCFFLISYFLIYLPGRIIIQSRKMTTMHLYFIDIFKYKMLSEFYRKLLIYIERICIKAMT